jgi:hypothetical protein
MVPFEQAPEPMAFFTGVEVDRDTARRLTEAAGAQLVAVEAADLATLLATLPDPPPGPAIQQLSVDGAMVPLVGGTWAEVKLLTLGTVAPTPAAAGAGPPQPHTTDLSYFARLADADAFATAAKAETHRRGTATAGTVAAVMDGAAWLQGFIDLHRPDAVRILDFPHAVQHLAAAGAAVWGEGSARTHCWLDQQVQALRTTDPAAILEAVATLPTEQAADPTGAAARVQETIGYLAARWDQLRYAAFRAGGLPIGSGCVESGHKVVTQARLKGRGMHWAPANVNPMLALRCALLNGRWAEAWPRLMRQWRQARADRTRARRRGRQTPQRIPPAAAPPAAPPTVAGVPVVAPRRAKTIIDGRPTAAHPWKRHARLPRSGAPLPAKR